MARRVAPAEGGHALRQAVLDGILEQGMPELFTETLTRPLRDGGPVVINRYDLPDWCPNRHVGHPLDWLLLDEHGALHRYP